MITEHIAILIQRRKQLGYSQEKLARMLDVSRGTIANIEQGTASPSWKLFYKICEVLNIEINLIIH